MMSCEIIDQNCGHITNYDRNLQQNKFWGLHNDMVDTHNSENDWNYKSPPSSSQTSESDVYLSTENRPQNGLSSDVTAITNYIRRLAIEEENNEPIKPFKGRSCTYCGINERRSLIKCRSCDKWFCNRGVNTSGSHAVLHFVFAKHKEVSYTSDKRDIQCHSCGSRNIFLLGYIGAKVPEKSLLFCRQPCAFESNKCDPDNWNPLINNRELVSWMVKVPSKEVRRVTEHQIRKLEKPSKDRSEPVFQYLNELVFERSHKYETGEEYQHFFGSLVKMEADYQTRIKDKVAIKWEIGVHNITGFFTLPATNQTIAYGDDLKVISLGKDNPWSGVAYVSKAPNPLSPKIGITMKNKKGVPTDRTYFILEFFWERITFDRIQKALSKFSKNDSAVSEHIYQKILGNEIKDSNDVWNAVRHSKPPKSVIKNRWGSYKGKGKAVTNFVMNFSLENELRASPLPKLNPSQDIAVRHSVENALTLIQGPPGTGKTVTSATIVYYLVKCVPSNVPVLVCAPSNVAVDHLTEKIHKTGLNVVRVYAKTREEKKTEVSHLSLHNLILKQNNELQELKRKLDKKGVLSKEDLKRYNELTKDSERQILKSADVICCTCIASGDKRLECLKFNSVLIDESTQATEPECMVPIVLGAKQVILVGDHKQLGPIVTCQKAGRDGYSQSLFERLVLIGERPLLLTIQYRMHPSLSKFPSDTFYEGLLEDGVNESDRKMKQLVSLWPQQNKPMFFYSCDGSEEFAGSGTSFLNRKEVSIVYKILINLFGRGIKANQIGVITPYEGQRAYLVDYLKYKGRRTSKRKFFEAIEVASVDAFQGREKDLIIFTCVRSNRHGGIGFLKDPRRLNVAITRARFGLIVLGNPNVLSKDLLWKSLITFYKSNNVLVEGPLDRLIPVE